jgi:2-isopropylmalate synthase
MTAPTDKRRVSIFDTTLRDGEQAPGNAIGPQDKLDLALRLEALGVDCVETGFPASSPSDVEATALIAKHLTRAHITTFCRAVADDVRCAVEAAGTDRHHIMVAATGSDMHLEHKRRITREEGVREVVDTVKLALSYGVESVTVGIEDASRGAEDLLRELTERSVEAGARTFVVADTCGALTPQEYGDLIARFRRWAPAPLRIATHCHDDFGLSTANALAGLLAGADEVHVTLGGIGERAGNTALEEIAALLAYKSEETGLYTQIDLAAMYEAYTHLRGVISLPEPRNKAIFGTHAFGTAAGLHQQGMLRNPATYEYVEPERFGRRRTLLIGRHSGRTVLRHLLDEIGHKADDRQLEELYRRHIAERATGDAEDLEVIKARLAVELGC